MTAQTKPEKKYVFWVNLMDNILWLDWEGEWEDLNMSNDGLGSMIHDDGDPEPPSDWSCMETERKKIS